MYASASLTSLPSSGPAGAPPPGEAVHFGGRTSSQNGAIASIAVLTAFASGGLLIRLFTQCFVSSGLALEDGIITFADVSIITISLVGAISTNHGFGKHMWNITMHEYAKILEFMYASSIVYLVAITAVKVAILLQIKRILSPRQGRKREWTICWILIIANIIFYTTALCFVIFRCSPINKAWDIDNTGHCLSLSGTYIAVSGFNIVSDFSILIFPMSIIFRLQMDTKRKIGVAGVFAVGIFACIASITRMYYSQRLEVSSDVSYYVWQAALWCIIEINAGIITFCLPIIPQFYHYIKSKIRTPQRISEEEMNSYERVKPKGSVRDPHGMPSLASFERDELASGDGAKNLVAISEDNDSDSLLPPRSVQ